VSEQNIVGSFFQQIVSSSNHSLDPMFGITPPQLKYFMAFVTEAAVKELFYTQQGAEGLS
jgi:hypothetical protein